MKREEQDLLKLKSILNSINIPFFLMQGTLLGAIRDGTLIQYDKDIDLGCSADVEDPAIRMKIMHAFVKDGLNITLRGPGDNPRRPLYWILITGLKWQVALLFFKEIDGQVLFTTCPIFFPAYLFHNLKEIDFLGEKFLVPNPPEEYLKVNYGKTWRIPAQRRVIIKDSDPIEIYEPPQVEKVYLKCEKDGTLIVPLESIGPQLD
uniref:LicD/FKTN/FKRP nucleotidyltransferase domain-containing protein n=1 Tax=viral metagenome TaxID=1070528 RepID=A0A6M3MGG4_9ZZZZ